VFVVGSLGGSESAAAVLFERESVQRDTSTRRKAGQDIAESVASSVDTVGGNRPEWVTWRESDQANAAHCDNFAGTLNCNKGQQGGIIVQPIVIDRAAFNQGYGALYPPRIEMSETMSALVAKGPHAVATQAVPFYDPSPTLTAKMQGASGWATYNETAHLVGVPMFAHAQHGTNTNEEVKPVGVDLYNNTTTGDVHVPLRTAGGHGAPACLVPSPYVVRRLTPRECERLQGFPDDWTAVPFRGKPAADGPRYKALGNSMAVNCMEWIGERIAAYEASKQA
jgi:DNA (cytosine-5)-methyltransferase 1